jgi:phosphatidylserine/phosphatidylglycerophosphate/cardiolipin synthase-like enzyme
MLVFLCSSPLASASEKKASINLLSRLRDERSFDTVALLAKVAPMIFLKSRLPFYRFCASLLCAFAVCGAATPAVAPPAAVVAVWQTRAPAPSRSIAVRWGVAAPAPPQSRETAAVVRSARKVAGQQAEVVAVGFSPGEAESIVLSTIGSARRELRLAAYSFSSRKVMYALAAARRRGVDVRLVLDSKGASRTSIKFLRDNGISFRTCLAYKIMHNKFVVIDGAIVQTGSFNYTRAAALDNAENVLVLRSPPLAATYLQEWSRLWEESRQP